MFGAIPSPSSNAIEIGPLDLRAYGLMIALGVFAAVWLAQKRWAAQGHDPERLHRRRDARGTGRPHRLAPLSRDHRLAVVRRTMGRRVQDLAGRPRHPRRDARRRARRRRGLRAGAGHDAARRARRRRAGAAARAGHRPARQLVQPGAVRRAHRPAVGARDRPRASPAGLRRRTRRSTRRSSTRCCGTSRCAGS